MAAGVTAVVGRMPPCHPGKNKIKHFKKWNDWIGEAEKMVFLSMDPDKQTINLIRSCGDRELIEFWGKKVHCHSADPDCGIAAQAAHSYADIMLGDQEDEAQYC